MFPSAKLDCDRIHVLLFQKETSELLLVSADEGSKLPVLEIPRFSRVAQELTAAIEIQWKLRVCCLFSPPTDPDLGPSLPYQVAETYGPNTEAPAGMRWVPVHSTTRINFRNPGDFAAIEMAVSTLDGYRSKVLQGFFGRPGWLPVVIDWVAVAAARVGLKLTAKIRQLNASPTFSLIRFETTGPALWFKAVGEPNLHEYSVTLKLASLFPEFLPHILASYPEWNAWLAVESEGLPLDRNSSAAAWASAAENLALFQIASFGRGFSFINAGSKDLRPCMLSELVFPFIGAMTELMERQTKSAPARLTRQELFSLRTDITSAFRELQDSAIPNTLGHLDMNLGNVLVKDTRCVFLDWAEAYVGPPFFGYQYLLERLRRLHGSSSLQEESFANSYAKHWSSFASPEQIAANLRLVPLVAAFTCAASSPHWQHLEVIRPETSAYLRSLTRRMKLEADTWQLRRVTCVP